MLPRRLVHLVIVLFGITLVTFLLLRLIPGDPALAILGSSYTHARAVAIDNFLGLNRPIWIQYGLFMGRLARGNLGFSFFYNLPASTVIAHHVAPTLFLVIYSAVLAAAISFPIGFGAGLRRGGVLDQSARVFFTLSFAMPDLVLPDFSDSHEVKIAANAATPRALPTLILCYPSHASAERLRFSRRPSCGRSAASAG